MKYRWLIAGLVLLPVPAGAQVVVNPAALAQLADIAPPPPPPLTPRTRPPVHRAAFRVRAHPAARLALPGKTPPRPQKPVVPPTAAIPPPPPSRPAQPVAIAFATGSAALPPNAAAALAPLCHEAGTVMINAASPGGGSDPSVAMRLSLSRAFAIRAALSACGIPTSRIIPRAFSAKPGAGADITQVSLAP